MRWGGLMLSVWRVNRRVKYSHTLNGGIAMNDHIMTAERLTAYGCYLKQEERAPATLEKYLRDIRAFAAWLGTAL